MSTELADIAEPEVIDELRDMLAPSPEKRESGWELDLNDLYAKNSKYPPEQKLYAVLCYMVDGTSIKAGKRSGVDPATIRWWKSEAVWWEPALKELRRQYQDKLDANLTRLIHTVSTEIEDRILNGDERANKDGEIYNIKVSAKEMATILGILYDKRALLRGDPTSNPGKGNNSQLDSLTKRFEDFAQKMKDSGNMAKPIEGSYQTSADAVINEES